MRKVRIESIRPKLHALTGKCLNLLALRKRGAPDLPPGVRTDHLLAVLVDAFRAFRHDPLVPAPPQIGIGKNVAGDSRSPEHVEVVNFPEQVLNFFQVVAPGLVLDRKKILDDVAEALDADAQAVECDLRTITQSATVECVGGRPALQSQMLEERAAGADPGSASGKSLAPLPPLFPVEF